jgi:hypothetical protein
MYEAAVFRHRIRGSRSVGLRFSCTVSRYGTRFAFLLGADGKATGLTINPGRWAEHGERISD